MKTFTDRVVAVAAELGVVVLDVDAASITLKAAAGEPEIRLDLVRLAGACRGLSEIELGARVAERVAAALDAGRTDTGLDLGATLPHLRPEGDTGPWSRPLVAGHLRRCLVEDGTQTMRYLQPMDLVKTGLSVAKLDARAEENLARWAPQGRWVPAPEIGPGVLASRVRDGHDAARFLIAERWFLGEEQLFCLMPTRDHLWVVPGSQEGAASAAMGLTPLARQVAAQSSYPLSDAVFVNAGGRLRVLKRAEP